jgi:site-specific DNA recombinase
VARKSRKKLPQPEQAAASVLLPELEAKMPAAIYGRLSVEDEETEESMETQIALVQDYINRSAELSLSTGILRLVSFSTQT